MKLRDVKRAAMRRIGHNRMVWWANEKVANFLFNTDQGREMTVRDAALLLLGRNRVRQIVGGAR